MARDRGHHHGGSGCGHGLIFTMGIYIRGQVQVATTTTRNKGSLTTRFDTGRYGYSVRVKRGRPTGQIRDLMWPFERGRRVIRCRRREGSVIRGGVTYMGDLVKKHYLFNAIQRGRVNCYNRNCARNCNASSCNLLLFQTRGNRGGRMWGTRCTTLCHMMVWGHINITTSRAIGVLWGRPYLATRWGGCTMRLFRVLAFCVRGGYRPRGRLVWAPFWRGGSFMSVCFKTTGTGYAVIVLIVNLSFSLLTFPQARYVYSHSFRSFYYILQRYFRILQFFLHRCSSGIFTA